jgi:hypothetical protein
MLRKANLMQTASNNPGTPAGYSIKKNPGHCGLQNQPTKRSPLAHLSL